MESVVNYDISGLWYQRREVLGSDLIGNNLFQP